MGLGIRDTRFRIRKNLFRIQGSKSHLIPDPHHFFFLSPNSRTKTEKLAEKLRAARSEQEKLEDNYRAELRAQTKLVDLYRQHGEENTAKTDELSRALTDLQQLLKGTVSQEFIRFSFFPLIINAKLKFRYGTRSLRELSLLYSPGA
jgi:hypothetical protein